MGLIRGNIQQKVIETAAPAAGAESITTVPAGKYWRLSLFTASLTTDATVATRVPSLVIDDGTNVLLRFLGSGSQSVSASSTLAFPAAVVGASTIAITGVSVSGAMLPDPLSLVLMPGWRIRTLTSAIVAGDQWGIARLVVQEDE